VTPQSEIESLAKKLLRRDYPDQADQMRAVRWAEDQFYNLGLWPVGNLNTETDPANILFNLIEENVLLPDWMTARGVYLTNVLQAEDFRDLIDRLTPAYWDETPLDPPDDDAREEPPASEESGAAEHPRQQQSGDDQHPATALPTGEPDQIPHSLESAARGLRELFEDPDQRCPTRVGRRLEGNESGTPPQRSDNSSKGGAKP
jgi:hypothetical protein